MNTNPTYVDITIECPRCRTIFTWSSGEQAFYAGLGYSRPKICKHCRDVNRASRAAEAQAVREVK